MVVVGVLLVAVGFCLFDVPDAHAHGHGHDHESPRDLCLGMVVIALVVTLLSGPLPSGWAEALRRPLLRVRPVQVLDPPPRALSLA